MKIKVNPYKPGLDLSAHFHRWKVCQRCDCSFIAGSGFAKFCKDCGDKTKPQRKAKANRKFYLKHKKEKKNARQ